MTWGAGFVARSPAPPPQPTPPPPRVIRPRRARPRSALSFRQQQASPFYQPNPYSSTVTIPPRPMSARPPRSVPPSTAAVVIAQEHSGQGALVAGRTIHTMNSPRRIAHSPEQLSSSYQLYIPLQSMQQGTEPEIDIPKVLLGTQQHALSVRLKAYEMV